MNLDELISKVVALGREEVNFDLGNRQPAEEWVAAERKLGRPIAGSWRRFVAAFGNGRIWVRNQWYDKRDDGTRPRREPFQANDDPNVREACFEIEVSSSLYIEPFWDGGLVDGSDDWKNWCCVGGSGSGDHLLLRAERAWKQAPADAELAWYNHEVGALTYRWPGLAQFLEHMLAFHAEGTPQLVGEKGRAAYKVEQDAKRFEDAAQRRPDAQAMTAAPNAAGWVKCPHCGWRFSVHDAHQWNGQIHGDCGQRLDIAASPG